MRECDFFFALGYCWVHFSQMVGVIGWNIYSGCEYMEVNALSPSFRSVGNFGEEFLV